MRGGKSPGTAEGNGDGRGAIGVTAGPGAVIGRGEPAAARGGSFVLACRRLGFAALRGFALRAVFARCLFPAHRRRFFALETFFFALRFFAMSLLRWI